jgi:hypothetical protein
VSSEATGVRVFVSYAHDSAAHVMDVRRLWLLLRGSGIDATLDLPAAQRRQDWPLWMLREVRAADFVAVVASPGYRDGAAGPIAGELRRDRAAGTGRFLAVLLPGGHPDDVPAFLGHRTVRHRVPELTEAGVAPLVRALVGAPRRAWIPAPRASEARVPAADLPVLSDLLLDVPGVTVPGTWRLILDLLPAEVVARVGRRMAPPAAAGALVRHLADHRRAEPWRELVVALDALAPGEPAVARFSREIVRLGLS